MVTIETPPAIYETQTVQFNCSVAPVGGAYGYRWSRDSEVLSEGVNASLTVAVPLLWAGSCLTCEVIGEGVNVSRRLQVLCKNVTHRCEGCGSEGVARRDILYRNC